MASGSLAAVSTPRYVPIDKAAAYLDTSPKTIRRSIAEGRLTGYRFGKRLIRVDLNEVDALMRPIPTSAADVA